MQYKNEFEEEITNWLTINGWRPIRSIYVTGIKDEISQVDIVALGKGFLCIELKGHPVSWVGIIKGASKWQYRNIYGKTGTMISPYLQNKRHKESIYNYCLRNLKHCVSIPKPHSVCILNGDININNDISRDINLFSWNNINEINIQLGGYENIPNWDIIDNELYSILSPLSDTSSERLDQHIKYLDYCKKNRLGAWS